MKLQVTTDRAIHTITADDFEVDMDGYLILIVNKARVWVFKEWICFNVLEYTVKTQ